jgi:hypothetical protein
MEVSAKLVALVLAIVMLVIPAVALAACPSRMELSGREASPTDMVGMSLPPVEMSTVANSCCKVIPAEVGAASAFKPRATIGADVLSVLAASIVDVEPPVKHIRQTEMPPASSTASQALLCVFLI